MNYEKKYKEALETARKINSGEGVAAPPDWTVYEVIFPELKESEDEKIRKAIIRLVEINKESMINNVTSDSMLSWLEKQDSHYTFEIKKGHWYKCVCDYMLNGSNLMFKNGRLYYCRSDWRLESEIDERNVKDIGVHGYKSFFRPATNQEIKDWLEKQGQSFPILSNSSKTGKDWTEEDEHHWMMCLECVEECATQKRKDFSKTISWLKQRKQRLKQQ